MRAEWTDGCGGPRLGAWGLLTMIAGTVSYLHVHTLVALHGNPCGWWRCRRCRVDEVALAGSAGVSAYWLRRSHQACAAVRALRLHLWMPEAGGRGEDADAGASNPSGTSPGPESGSGPRWPPTSVSKTATWALSPVWRLAGRSVVRITRALNDAAIPCLSDNDASGECLVNDMRIELTGEVYGQTAHATLQRAAGLTTEW